MTFFSRPAAVTCSPARDVAVISVSMDLGAGRRGVDMGPSALRIAGLTGALEAIGRRVIEAGTITALDMEMLDPGDGTVRFIGEVPKVTNRVRKMVIAALRQGRVPLILGGDHSLSIGSVAGVAEYHRDKGESVGVIWVDAHADMNLPDTTPSGNIHGMPLAVLMGHGDRRLTGEQPSVRPENVTVVGAREIDPGEKELIARLGVRVFTMSEVDEIGVAACMDEALERANAGTAGFHLSLDLDSLDPAVAPGVGTPVQGGLTYREGHLVCEKACRSNRMVSLEVVELNPVLDDRNRTASLAIGLLASALGKTVL